jgi:phthiocerol/phenolphthiocerol synthesis type-I polyketide synthase E
MKEPRKRNSLPEGVAIVGMSCRFPGAAGIEELWRNLRDGVESIRFFTPSELEEAGVDPARSRNPAYVPARAVLDRVEEFDASFFGFNPAVATAMDPQQRLFLECAWEALERAGYDSAAYPGAIGVFGGVGINTYLLSRAGNLGSLFGSVGALQTSIGNRNDHLTTMVAYRLNLKGPAVTVQTACSTSLVAVHLACQSLLSYQCQMALAGGVRISVPQQEGYLHQTGDILSPDGHCRPFDAEAQGTVSGSGAGVVLLKRLSDALADGDWIHAVIRGSAINNDGSAKAGYTAPSIEGQAKVIARAQALAGVHPEQVGYVEAHGTGTPLGDPIEVAALDRVFRTKSQKRAFCALGSVKSNFGHLDTAAGVAGLIKTALALERRQIPPSLHFQKPNPELRLEESAFYVSSTLNDWPASDSPRYAGVSSFGIGGTNAHVVLEEPPEREQSGPSRPWQLLVLSARSGPALDRATDALCQYLQEQPEANLADVAHTLRIGRRAFSHRRALVCRSTEEAAEILGSLDPMRLFTSLQPPKPRPVIFQFPGQGSQHARMGRELYETEPEFRRQVDLCSELLRPWLRLDLRTELWAPEEESRLEQTFLTQPALFVLEYALARLWMSWGLTPRAMIGHSLGEYVAACLAGVFSLEDALRVVAERGRLIQSLPPGAMLSVQLPEAEIRRRLNSDLSLAAVNRPSLCVVSGPIEPIERLERELTAEEVVVRRLRTSHAFHSSIMEPVLAAFEDLLRSLPLRPPGLPFVSNLTGRWIEPGEATDPLYWVRHLRSTVRFSEGLETLLRDGEAIFLEVGPSTTLTSLARQHPKRTVDHLLLASLQQGREWKSEGASLLAAVGRLWLSGMTMNWAGFQGEERRQRRPLPTYPFERRRFWLDLDRTPQRTHPAQGPWKPDHGDWFWVPSWNRSHPVEAVPGERLRWLLFVDGAGLGSKIAEELRSLAQEVVEVQAGDGFARVDADLYAVKPAQPSDYTALLDTLHKEGRLPQRILHLWGVDPHREEEVTPDLRREMLERGFYSLLFLAQALGGLMERPPLRLDMITSGMQEVIGGDLRWPEKAAALGPCRVIPKEYVDVRCRSIDLSGPGDARALLAELLSTATEPSVAYRGSHRWTQTYIPMHLEAPEGLGGLRQEGVYLITGGFRGIGMAVAEHLARTVSARLVLAARSHVPPRAEWCSWIQEHGENDDVSRTIRRLEALEASGAEILAVSADVTDEERMRTLAAEVRERFGALHGVFHSAGVSPGGLIQLKSAEAAARIMAPKVEGARALLAALEGVELDFLALFSSRSSVFAPAGSVDYTAANTFLDALAHAVRTPNGPRIFSINWCGWEEVGMLADAVAQRRERAESPEREEEIPSDREKEDHPLLGWRHRNPGDRQVYESDFRLSTHWVVGEHRIAGYPVVVGTTYLEMTRAAIADRATQVEIFDVFFLNPMRLREDETRRVRLSLTPAEDGFELQVESRSADTEAPWSRHAMAKVRPLPSEPLRRHDLTSLLARCRREESLAAIRDEQNQDVDARWQIVKRVYVGDGEIMASLELPEEYAGDLEHYQLHPSLVDRSVSIGEAYLAEPAPYLPFSYRSIKFRAPLPRKIYSYARLTSGKQVHRETISFDILLLDEEGHELVEIREYVKKMVHDASGYVRASGRPAAVAEAEAESDLPEESGSELSRTAVSPAEGIDALRRILAHEVPPQVLVSPNNLLEAIAVANSLQPPKLDEDEPESGATGPARGHRRPDLSTPYEAPRTEVEQRLAALWQEVLGFEEVGIQDNFFELGGDSLLAVQIIARARRSGLELTPNQLFEHQSIAELASHLAPAPESGEATLPPPVRSHRDGAVPLSFSQQRLWFLQQLDPDSPVLNLFGAIRLQGSLDVAALEEALNEVRRRHDALRAVFSQTSGEPVQSFTPYRPVALPQVELGGLPRANREGELLRVAEATAQQPFDLTCGPLLRGVLLRLSADEHVVVFILHHIVGDGWSLGVLGRELGLLYEAFTAGRPSPLPELPVQYADFVQWQRQWLTGERLERQLAYWRQKLGGNLPVLLLPGQRRRPQVPSFRGATQPVLLSGELTASLEELARAEGATLFITLLAGFKALLHNYSGSDDLLVGTNVASRSREELEGLIGMLVNTLALRTDLSGRPSFRELVRRVRDVAVAAYARQEVPFEMVLEGLGLQRSGRHAPVFQTMFVFRSFPVVGGERGQGDDLRMSPFPLPEKLANFDLTLVMTDSGEGFFLYSTDLFEESSIAGMEKHLQALLFAAVADPDRPISDLSIVRESQERLLTVGFNDDF